MMKSLTVWDVMGKSRDQLIDYIEGMQMVIDRYENEKTAMWHDLRKNPDDLPSNSKVVITYSEAEGYCIGHYDRFQSYENFWEDEYGEIFYPDAWMEFPKFKGDEE